MTPAEKWIRAERLRVCLDATRAHRQALAARRAAHAAHGRQRVTAGSPLLPCSPAGQQRHTGLLVAEQAPGRHAKGAGQAEHLVDADRVVPVLGTADRLDVDPGKLGELGLSQIPVRAQPQQACPDVPSVAKERILMIVGGHQLDPDR